ncbi:ranBP2-type zinc finger protein At1g67325-like isoform X2 [Macadamia integrifolia]|uniref:ranBP2-type zinc finger protein At1g67325-like isoform X2 n=1 Tax=Macadamia integrifolia TaxID=60698 RepID=UPI001C4F7A19|nr:ranBP2-type zinc finger protein At1g67325-like isoform X2 [Macadamia integrifolia]
MASAKVDNRGSLGSKRSRNDGTRNDGDWTCPQCGNVNFSFRTVCNRGKCGAARPPSTPRMGSAPVPSPFNNAPPYYLGGVGAPPPMPLGMPSSYGLPFSLSGMRYDYGAHGSATGPYGLMSAYPPGPLGGVAYGPGSALDGYGFGYRGSPLPMPGSWSGGGLPDNSASRKRRGGPDGLSEGDWVCPKCDNVNFAFRTTCNMKKCGAPRPSSGPNQSDSGVPEGSWTCSKCENLNYPFRTVCNRKGCGNEKPATAK